MQWSLSSCTAKRIDAVVLSSGEKKLVHFILHGSAWRKAVQSTLRKRLVKEKSLHTSAYILWKRSSLRCTNGSKHTERGEVVAKGNTEIPTLKWTCLFALLHENVFGSRPLGIKFIWFLAPRLGRRPSSTCGNATAERWAGDPRNIITLNHTHGVSVLYMKYFVIVYVYINK